MIKPTIGRIVWYHPGPNNSQLRLDTQPFAAIIAGVIDEHTVNLTCFDADGYPWPMRGVHLCQDDEQPEQYTAEWMPYQIGQAKKYEEGAAPVLDAKLQKIIDDQVELDRRMKLIKETIDLRSPDDPRLYYTSQDTRISGEPPIPPMTPDVPRVGQPVSATDYIPPKITAKAAKVEAEGKWPSGVAPLKPGTPNFEAQKAQDATRRDQEANTVKVTAPEQIVGKVPDKK